MKDPDRRPSVLVRASEPCGIGIRGGSLRRWWNLPALSGQLLLLPGLGLGLEAGMGLRVYMGFEGIRVSIGPKGVRWALKANLGRRACEALGGFWTFGFGF